MAAEKIEAAYKKNSLVEQIWVYGNSLESTLVAIVVPAGVCTVCLGFALCLSVSVCLCVCVCLCLCLWLCLCVSAQLSAVAVAFCSRTQEQTHHRIGIADMNLDGEALILGPSVCLCSVYAEATPAGYEVQKPQSHLAVFSTNCVSMCW